MVSNFVKFKNLFNFEFPSLELLYKNTHIKQLFWCGISSLQIINSPVAKCCTNKYHPEKKNTHCRAIQFSDIYPYQYRHVPFHFHHS